MKFKLLILITLATNLVFAKSNFTVNILVNGKIDATRYIYINDLHASLKVISNSSFNGLSIERTDLNIKEEYLKTSAIKFNDQIISADNSNCYDSAEIKSQYLNCYIKYSSTNDKIFLFDSKEDYQKLISEFINTNKPKQKKNYKFTIFINASTCKEPNKKIIPCPNSIEMIDRTVSYLERCKTANGKGVFLFKWKTNTEVPITKFKFFLVYKDRIILTDTFDNSRLNFIKSSEYNLYKMTQSKLSNLSNELENNESINDAEFQWYVECLCDLKKNHTSILSDPFTFLKCPSTDEALPCNE